MILNTLTRMHTKADTAILFFSRTAHEEAAYKVFDSSVSVQGNIEIGSSFIKHTINSCKSTGFPFFQYYSDKQIGSNFGERLANAMEDVFSHGYKNLVVLGNDCPFVDASMIMNAASQVQKNEFVLGPAFDGGVYLLALSSSSYNREKFIDLDWGSSLLQDGFKQYAQDVDDRIVWLDKQIDIDKEQDFKILLKLLARSSRLSKILFAIMATNHTFVHIEGDDFYPISIPAAHALRGPPLAA